MSSFTPDAFTDAHEELLRPIAALLGSAVEHWRIWDAERRRRERLARLDALFGPLSESLDIREVFERISEAVKPALPHDLLFLTDVHVKHARLLADKSLTESVADSVTLGSNGLIVTGDWTGNPPTITDLTQARKAAAGVPVIVGSGLSAANAPELLRHADGAIVGTSIKTGDAVDPQKAAELVTVLPNWSCTVTRTAGVIGAPATASVGCTEIARRLAMAWLMSNAAEVAPASPVEAAASV